MDPLARPHHHHHRAASGWRPVPPRGATGAAPRVGAGDAVVAVIASGVAAVYQRRRIVKRCGRPAHPQTAEHVDHADWKKFKFFMGNGIFLGSFLAAWHMLPVFLDVKIAADPALPGLTAEALPITTTAIFTGWLVGALCLKQCMEIFSKEQLMVGYASGLLVVNLATVTLPHLTAGNLVVFTCIRFVYGVLLNITGIQAVYVQEGLPERANQVNVALSIGYCMVLVMMSWMCGGPTLDWDWRLEALLWNGLPIFLGLVIGFPNMWDILEGGRKNARARISSWQGGTPEPQVDAPLSKQEMSSGLCLAISFLAAGCGFYGLSYSAGKLSFDVYESTKFLSLADILGYTAALFAQSLGRTRVQGACFAMAACCLFVCSFGDPGTPVVILSAMLGRLCLDVCCSTVYVGLAADFSQSAQRTVLPACEIACRLGAFIAPVCGTLPAALSCKVFGALCLAAAWATWADPAGQVETAEAADSASFSKEVATQLELEPITLSRA